MTSQLAFHVKTRLVYCHVHNISTNTTYNTSKRMFSSPSSVSTATTEKVPTSASYNTTSSTTNTNTPLGILGTLFFGSLCIGTFTLGVWQTQRYFEKEVLVKQRNTDLQLSPFKSYEEYVNSVKTTSDQSTAIPKQSFRRIQLQGRYHHDYEILVGPRGPPAGSSSHNEGGGGMASSPQGYYIITPFEIIPSSNDTTTVTSNTATPTTTTTNAPETINTTMDRQQNRTFVLINRGWVPRNMVKNSSSASRYRNSKDKSDHHETVLLNWDRPNGILQETVVSTKPEEPRFLVPQHDFSSHPAMLYWYDLPTMLEVANPNYSDVEGDSSEKQVGALPTILPYATKVVPSSTGNSAIAVQASKWPISPTAEKVGDFKVSPTVHVGYAVTWYGLSMAGLYMTRLLLLRK